MIQRWRAAPESCRLAAQLVIAEGSNLLLQQLNVRNDRLVALQLAGIGITQQELEHGDGNPESWGSLLRKIRQKRSSVMLQPLRHRLRLNHKAQGEMPGHFAWIERWILKR